MSGPTDKVDIFEIDHPEILLSEMAELGRSKALYDVTFEIQNQKIHGHLSILAARSEYFRALLFGGLAESQQNLIKLEVPIDAFQDILRYIYSGHLSLLQKPIENVLDTLCLAQEYGLIQLELSISKYLHKSLSLDNVCVIAITARMHGFETLQNACHTFLDANAKRIIVHESFKNLSEELLKDIICRDSFNAPEVQIFTAVKEWLKHNPNTATKSVVSLVRFPLMSLEELFKEVEPSGVIDSLTLLESIKQKAISTSLVYRTSLNKVRRNEDEENDEVEEDKEGKIGEIAHPEILLSEISQLCMSEELSDVTFEIQNETIPGHLSVLIARSEYFQAFFFGERAELKQEKVKLAVPIHAFKALLRYIYSGKLSLSQMDIENVLDTLCLAYTYRFTQLKLSIWDYLLQSLSLDNVCLILDTSRNYEWNTLKNACHSFLDTNAKEILVHKSFKHLSEESIKEIIRRDSFYAPEVQIFTAVKEWLKHNPNTETESVVSLVRFPLMSFEELFKEVQPSEVIDGHTLLKAIKQKTMSTSFPYRGKLWQEENVIDKKFGSSVIQGQDEGRKKYECVNYHNGYNYCNDDEYDDEYDGYNNYDDEYDGYNNYDKGYNYYRSFSLYAHHTITENNDLGIIIELGSITIINHMKLLLSKEFMCSYFVDVSIDKICWQRVVDHQSYLCQSLQSLYFPSRAVRYIKLVGTDITNSISEMFEVISLEAYYTAEVPKIIDGIVVPTKNVASSKMGALVGSSCTNPQFLLDGRDIISKFTYHKIGKGSIEVQLAQPYVIGTMRLVLLDCNDNRKYSFYIETSTNKKDWEVVIDKRNEDCRSCQNLIFEPKVMVFIRIIGTKSTVKNEFHCLYFECPSQTTNITDDNQI